MRCTFQEDPEGEFLAGLVFCGQLATGVVTDNIKEIHPIQIPETLDYETVG